MRRWFRVLGGAGFRDFAHRQENGFVASRNCFAAPVPTKWSLTGVSDRTGNSLLSDGGGATSAVELIYRYFNDLCNVHADPPEPRLPCGVIGCAIDRTDAPHRALSRLV